MPVALGVALLLAAAPPGEWYPGTRARAQVTVTLTGVVDAGYVVDVLFNHAAELDAGRALASGDDVQLVQWADGGWVSHHRVLDSNARWGDPDTRLWFRLPMAVAASNDDLYLVWGGAPPAPVLNDPNLVYLFADDFESGQLLDWAASPLMGTTDFTNTNDSVAHSGTRTLRQRPRVASTSQQFGITNPLPPDVLVEAWWYLEAPTTAGMQLGWLTRFDLNNDNEYVLRYRPTQWDLAQRLAGTYTQYGATVPLALVANTWTRVELGVEGNQLYAFVDGTMFLNRTASGARDAGTVGLARITTSAELAPDGGHDWLIDDVRVRPFRFPEPVATLGAVVFGPGERCVSDQDCVTRCLSGFCAVADAGVDAGTDAGVTDAGADDAGTDAGADDAGAAPRRREDLVGCACSGVDGSLVLAFLSLLFRRRAR